MEKFVKELLLEKEKYWNTEKEAAEDNMSDLAHLFSENASFKRIKANKKYSEWFAAMDEKITNLDVESVNDTSKKIQQYTRALLSIEKYDQIENNM